MATIDRNQSAEYLQRQPQEVKIIDGCAVRFSDVCVYEFVIGDVEDPDLYAGAPIWEWQQSAAGTWVMEQAVEKVYWVQHMDPFTYGYKYRIMARLSDQDQTFWRLKWGGWNSRSTLK